MSNIPVFNRRAMRIVILVALGIVLMGLFLSKQRQTSIQTKVDMLVLPAAASEGFKRVTGPLIFVFPQDHGPHLDYQTEWWYYTGNLQSQNGQYFGYQLTFFRRGIVPPALATQSGSVWRTEQVYFAHLALSDVDRKLFYNQERFSRGAAGLAGADGDPVYSVWLEDWNVNQVDDNTYRLQASTEDFKIALTLVDKKGPVLQGERGYSPKGPEPGNASAYISQTRLASTGTIEFGNVSIQVEGWSWMDHEFSTSALGSGQVGWDWFSIQLDDNSELMLFNLRREDGALDPYSAGTYIAADGTIRQLKSGDFEILPTSEWRSPHSGAIYPAGWQIRIKSLDLILTVTPLLDDQELNLSFVYWEGAVKIAGQQNGIRVDGYGFVELTGYAQSMQGQF